MSMLISMLYQLVNLYSMLIFIYCLLTWIPTSYGGLLEQIKTGLAMICEPFLGLFRGIIPPIGMVDISPIVAIFALQLIMRLIWYIF